MSHVQLAILANEHQQEELIALLSDHNPAGFQQTDDRLIAFFNSKDFEQHEVAHIIEGYDFDLSMVEDRNWNEEWERNFHPVVVEDFCAVRAHFHAPAQDVQHEIIITPKMSFGTGHHATTYMMILQMREMNFEGANVFDFGTGTGILAILAEKLGASKVTAIDVDEWSIDNAQENCKNNQCNRVRISLSTYIPGEQFDIILANINRNVILDYLPRLKQALRPGGSLLVSGILVTDEHDVVQSCQQKGLTLTKSLQKDNWSSACFVNGQFRD